jgi:hypothetical protein
MGNIVSHRLAVSRPRQLGAVWGSDPGRGQLVLVGADELRTGPKYRERVVLCPFAPAIWSSRLCRYRRMGESRLQLSRQRGMSPDGG